MFFPLRQILLTQTPLKPSSTWSLLNLATSPRTALRMDFISVNRAYASQLSVMETKVTTEKAERFILDHGFEAISPQLPPPPASEPVLRQTIMPRGSRPRKLLMSLWLGSKEKTRRHRGSNSSKCSSPHLLKVPFQGHCRLMTQTWVLREHLIQTAKFLNCVSGNTNTTISTKQQTP